MTHVNFCHHLASIIIYCKVLKILSKTVESGVKHHNPNPVQISWQKKHIIGSECV
jgi:hypothetical protein